MDSCKDKIRELYLSGDWRGIVQLFENGFCDEKLLWFQPDLDGIDFLEKSLATVGVKGISSIGCGTGLLEWIINSSTGPDEKNKNRYCDPQPFQLKESEGWRIHAIWRTKFLEAIVIYRKCVN